MMDPLVLARSARVTLDESGNPVVIVPLPLWEELLAEISEHGSSQAQQTLNTLEPLSVGHWPESLHLTSRDEYYGDDGG